MDEEREKLKQQLLEELKKEYQIIPLKEARFTVKDIIEKYIEQICSKLDIPNSWRNKEAVANSIRKTVAMHFGCANASELKPELRNQYREEVERFIKEYLLNE